MNRQLAAIILLAVVLALLVLLVGLFNSINGLMNQAQAATSIAQVTPPPTRTPPPPPTATPTLTPTVTPTPDGRSPFLFRTNTGSLPSDGASTAQLTLQTIREDWTGRRVTFFVRGDGSLDRSETQLPTVGEMVNLNYIAGTSQGTVSVEAAVQDGGALVTQDVTLQLLPTGTLELSGSYTLTPQGLRYRLQLELGPEATQRQGRYNLTLSLDQNGLFVLPDGTTDHLQRLTLVLEDGAAAEEVLIRRTGPSPISFEARLHNRPEDPLRAWLYDVDALPAGLRFTNTNLDEARREVATGVNFTSCVVAHRPNGVLSVPDQLGIHYQPLLMRPGDDPPLFQVGHQMLAPNTWAYSRQRDDQRHWFVVEGPAMCWLWQPQQNIAGLFRLSASPGPRDFERSSVWLLHRGRITFAAGTTFDVLLDDGQTAQLQLARSAAPFMLDTYQTARPTHAILPGWLPVPNPTASTPADITPPPQGINTTQRFYTRLDRTASTLVGNTNYRFWPAFDARNQLITARSFDGQTVYRAYLLVRTRPNV